MVANNKLCPAEIATLKSKFLSALATPRVTQTVEATNFVTTGKCPKYSVVTCADVDISTCTSNYIIGAVYGNAPCVVKGNFCIASQTTC